MFIQYLNGAILSEKSFIKGGREGGGEGEKYKKKGWPYRKGVVCRREDSNLLQTMLALGWTFFKQTHANDIQESQNFHFQYFKVI